MSESLKDEEAANKYWREHRDFHDSDGVDVCQVFKDGAAHARRTQAAEIERLKAELWKSQAAIVSACTAVLGSWHILQGRGAHPSNKAYFQETHDAAIALFEKLQAENGGKPLNDYEKLKKEAMKNV